jgi:hypothetical protein
MANRFHWTTKAAYDAACDDCSWRSTAANAQGAAALHHDRTAHTVRVEVVRNVIYETRDRYTRRTGQKPDAGTQGKLL